MIQPEKEIKALGKFKVKISLHSEVDAEININVESMRAFSNYTIFSPTVFRFFFKNFNVNCSLMENNLSIVKEKFKELPNNIEAEQAVIGSILVTNEIFDEINTIISSINFYDPMHQKIFNAIESLIYKGMLANPITLKNYFEAEKDELNVPEYLVKVTKFSTSTRQATEYSKIIYDMFVRRELIKISEETIDTAKINDLNVSGQNIIEKSEKIII